MVRAVLVLPLVFSLLLLLVISPNIPRYAEIDPELLARRRPVILTLLEEAGLHDFVERDEVQALIHDFLDCERYYSIQLRAVELQIEAYFDQERDVGQKTSLAKAAYRFTIAKSRCRWTMLNQLDILKTQLYSELARRELSTARRSHTSQASTPRTEQQKTRIVDAVHYCGQLKDWVLERIKRVFSRISEVEEEVTMAVLHLNDMTNAIRRFTTEVQNNEAQLPEPDRARMQEPRRSVERWLEQEPPISARITSLRQEYSAFYSQSIPTITGVGDVDEQLKDILGSLLQMAEAGNFSEMPDTPQAVGEFQAETTRIAALVPAITRLTSAVGQQAQAIHRRIVDEIDHELARADVAPMRVADVRRRMEQIREQYNNEHRGLTQTHEDQIEDQLRQMMVPAHFRRDAIQDPTLPQRVRILETILRVFDQAKAMLKQAHRIGNAIHEALVSLEKLRDLLIGPMEVLVNQLAGFNVSPLPQINPSSSFKVTLFSLATAFETEAVTPDAPHSQVLTELRAQQMQVREKNLARCWHALRPLVPQTLLQQWEILYSAYHFDTYPSAGEFAAVFAQAKFQGRVLRWFLGRHQLSPAELRWACSALSLLRHIHQLKEDANAHHFETLFFKKCLDRQSTLPHQTPRGLLPLFASTQLPTVPIIPPGPAPPVIPPVVPPVPAPPAPVVLGAPTRPVPALPTVPSPLPLFLGAIQKYIHTRGGCTVLTSTSLMLIQARPALLTGMPMIFREAANLYWADAAFNVGLIGALPQKVFEQASILAQAQRLASIISALQPREFPSLAQCQEMRDFLQANCLNFREVIANRKQLYGADLALFADLAEIQVLKLKYLAFCELKGDLQPLKCEFVWLGGQLMMRCQELANHLFHVAVSQSEQARLKTFIRVHTDKLEFTPVIGAPFTHSTIPSSEANRLGFESGFITSSQHPRNAVVGTPGFQQYFLAAEGFVAMEKKNAYWVKPQPAPFTAYTEKTLFFKDGHLRWTDGVAVSNIFVSIPQIFTPTGKQALLDKARQLLAKVGRLIDKVLPSQADCREAEAFLKDQSFTYFVKDHPETLPMGEDAGKFVSPSQFLELEEAVRVFCFGEKITCQTYIKRQRLAASITPTGQKCWVAMSAEERELLKTPVQKANNLLYYYPPIRDPFVCTTELPPIAPPVVTPVAPPVIPPVVHPVGPSSMPLLQDFITTIFVEGGFCAVTIDRLYLIRDRPRMLPTTPLLFVENNKLHFTTGDLKVHEAGPVPPKFTQKTLIMDRMKSYTQGLYSLKFKLPTVQQCEEIRDFLEANCLRCLKPNFQTMNLVGGVSSQFEDLKETKQLHKAFLAYCHCKTPNNLDIECGMFWSNKELLMQCTGLKNSWRIALNEAQVLERQTFFRVDRFNLYCHPILAPPFLHSILDEGHLKLLGFDKGIIDHTGYIAPNETVRPQVENWYLAETGFMAVTAEEVYWVQPARAKPYQQPCFFFEGDLIRWTNGELVHPDSWAIPDIFLPQNKAALLASATRLRQAIAFKLAHRFPTLQQCREVNTMLTSYSFTFNHGGFRGSFVHSGADRALFESPLQLLELEKAYSENCLGQALTCVLKIVAGAQVVVVRQFGAQFQVASSPEEALTLRTPFCREGGKLMFKNCYGNSMECAVKAQVQPQPRPQPQPQPRPQPMPAPPAPVVPADPTAQIPEAERITKYLLTGSNYVGVTASCLFKIKHEQGTNVKKKNYFSNNQGLFWTDGAKRIRVGPEPPIVGQRQLVLKEARQLEEQMKTLTAATVTSEQCQEAFRLLMDYSFTFNLHQRVFPHNLPKRGGTAMEFMSPPELKDLESQLRRLCGDLL